jgi:thiosulfate dehydrogenase [quinone] large subunit
MSTSPSTRRSEVTTASIPVEEQDANRAPIRLGETSLLIIALVRIFVGYLWFQQLSWKLPPTFGGLHTFVVREVTGTFIPGYGWILQNVLLPNFGLLGTFTFTAELLIGISLMFGLFSRFGAFLATVMALQLYVGLSNTEWYWTYGMLVLLGVVLIPIPTGRRLGIDQWLAPRFQAMASTSRSRITQLLAWLV